MESVVFLALAMLSAPLFSAVILKVKAFFGAPLLINYYTLVKLFQKGSVYNLCG